MEMDFVDHVVISSTACLRNHAEKISISFCGIYALIWIKELRAGNDIWANIVTFQYNREDLVMAEAVSKEVSDEALEAAASTGREKAGALTLAFWLRCMDLPNLPSRAFPKFESYGMPVTAAFRGWKAQDAIEWFHGIGRLGGWTCS